MLALPLRLTRYWHSWNALKQSRAARASARYFLDQASGAIAQSLVLFVPPKATAGSASSSRLLYVLASQHGHTFDCMLGEEYHRAITLQVHKLYM